jgi:hypothetical protein
MSFYYSNKWPVLTKKVYYNKTDLDQGNGFYPQMAVLYGQMYSNMYVRFRLFIYMDLCYGWTQVSGPAIAGFTQRDGEQLLQSLNGDTQFKANVISNFGGRIIYPATINTTHYILANYNALPV